MIGGSIRRSAPGVREARDPAAQGALRDARLPGTVAGGLAEEDDGPQELVALLLGRGDEEAQLLPIDGRL